jgi:hypothetical protein
VRIGEGDTAGDERHAVLRNIVDNNLICDGDHLFHGGPGVWIGRSSFNEVTHNEIFDFSHIGISVGWQWGYAPPTAHQNQIAYNHVHHIGRGILSDMGRIYLLGISPGTVVRNNIVHEIRAYPKFYNKLLNEGGGVQPVEGAGIYPDEGCSGVTFEKNLIYDVHEGTCFSVNYCRNNIAHNNVFALSRHGMGFNHADHDFRAMDFHHNIVCCLTPRVLTGDWSGRFRSDHNLFWTPSGKELDFSGKTLGQWRAAGHDRCSIVADPLFLHLENRDFRLMPGSPARQMDIEPLDVAEVGLYGKREWVAMPKLLPTRANDPSPPKRPPETINDGFERGGIYRAMVIGFSDSKVTITDEVAAMGKHSLKFERPKNDNPFAPYLYYEPNFETGRVRFSCDVMNRNDRPADFVIQMRDWQANPSFYQTLDHPRIGPNCRFHPDGTVTSGRCLLTRTRLGQWIHVEILVQLGLKDPKTFGLTIGSPSESPRTFTIPYASTSFSMMSWLGFAGVGTAMGEFYVDNIHLEEEQTR